MRDFRIQFWARQWHPTSPEHVFRSEKRGGRRPVPAARLIPQAAAASRDFARTVVGATRLIAIIHPDNRPSQRVAEKIGLRPEKRATVHGGREAVIYAAALDQP